MQNLNWRMMDKTTTPEVISRADAKARGLTHYFTGKPCKNGHTAERFVSCRKCKECAVLECRAELRHSAWSKAWRLANQEREKATRRANYQRRKSEWPAYVAKRRARKLHATQPWFGEFDDLVAVEAAHLAALRERVTGFAWHVDHMVPLQARNVCGLHVAQNLQVIPAWLNLAKRNQLQLTAPGEWIKAA